MASSVQSDLEPVDAPSRRKRSRWRQQLVDAERGITCGFRGDCSFFVHFFAACVVVGSALALRVEYFGWIVLVLAMTIVMAAEMFRQVVKALVRAIQAHATLESADVVHNDERTNARERDPLDDALSIATGTVFVAMTGAVLVIGLVLGRQIAALFGQ